MIGVLMVTAELFVSVAVVSKVLVARLKARPERLTDTLSETSADQAGPAARQSTPTSTRPSRPRKKRHACLKIVMASPAEVIGPCAGR